MFLKRATGSTQIAQEAHKHGSDVIAMRQGVKAAVKTCQRGGKKDRSVTAVTGTFGPQRWLMLKT